MTARRRRAGATRCARDPGAGIAPALPPSSAPSFPHPPPHHHTHTRAHARTAAPLKQVAVAKTYFKGNSKSLAEVEPDGMGKLIFRADTGDILGCHLFGIHSADVGAAPRRLGAGGGQRGALGGSHHRARATARSGGRSTRSPDFPPLPRPPEHP